MLHPKRPFAQSAQAPKLPLDSLGAVKAYLERVPELCKGLFPTGSFAQDFEAITSKAIAEAEAAQAQRAQAAVHEAAQAAQQDVGMPQVVAPGTPIVDHEALAAQALAEAEALRQQLAAAQAKEAEADSLRQQLAAAAATIQAQAQAQEDPFKDCHEVPIPDDPQEWSPEDFKRVRDNLLISNEAKRARKDGTQTQASAQPTPTIGTA